MGNVSAFVAVASQLILIKSRAILPRHKPEGAVALADEGPDPEAELRARLILYRAFRDAGARLLDEAQARMGLWHREPAAARAAGVAGARPPAAQPLPVVAPGGGARGPRHDRPAAPAAARDHPPIGHPDRARDAHPAAPWPARTWSCSRTCSRGVTDRVVVAVTFLALLELMKRREIVVRQDEPWGPIMARRTTAEERAAAGVPDAIDEEAPLDESLESFS